MARPPHSADTLLDDRVDRGAGPYRLIVRGPDGRPHSEQFDDVTAYRARLAALQSSDGCVSFDDIIGLLDT